MSSNIQRKFFALNVRNNGSQPSIFVRSFSAITTWDAEREAYYRERSPLTRAARVTTPTLFLHPEVDLRCPIEQSEQFYMTLKMMGKVPVEFVRVPAAWHVGTTKPGQWFAYWEKALEWFRRYVEIRPEEYMNKL